MRSDILAPLATFCGDRRFRDSVLNMKNLSDSGNSFGEIVSTSSDHSLTVIETRFDLTLQVMHGPDEPTTVAMTTCTSRETPRSQKVHDELLQSYKIRPEYGTTFISETIPCSPDFVGSELDSVEILSAYPPAVMEYYMMWVAEYNEAWRDRGKQSVNICENVFFSAEEEVSWNVAGYLLAWRVAMAPEVGSVEYSTRQSWYILKTGNETDITIQFLKEQLYLLEKEGSS
jgi:hypothetical protein